MRINTFEIDGWTWTISQNRLYITVRKDLNRARFRKDPETGTWRKVKSTMTGQVPFTVESFEFQKVRSAIGIKGGVTKPESEKKTERIKIRLPPELCVKIRSNNRSLHLALKDLMNVDMAEVPKGDAIVIKNAPRFQITCTKELKPKIQEIVKKNKKWFIEYLESKLG